MKIEASHIDEQIRDLINQEAECKKEKEELTEKLEMNKVQQTVISARIVDKILLNIFTYYPIIDMNDEQWDRAASLLVDKMPIGAGRSYYMAKTINESENIFKHTEISQSIVFNHPVNSLVLKFDTYINDRRVFNETVIMDLKKESVVEGLTKVIDILNKTSQIEN